MNCAWAPLGKIQALEGLRKLLLIFKLTFYQLPFLLQPRRHSVSSGLHPRVCEWEHPCSAISALCLTTLGAHTNEFPAQKQIEHSSLVATSSQ